MKRMCEFKKMFDLESKLFDIFEEEKWFHNVKLRFHYVESGEVKYRYYEINLIVYESFSIWDFNDVKNELKYLEYKVYDDNPCIKKRDGKDTYSVKFLVERVKE